LCLPPDAQYTLWATAHQPTLCVAQEGEHNAMSEAKSNRPKWISKPQLAAVGLRLIRRAPLVVQYQICGAEWQPVRRPGARWWLCHNGCNEPAKE
jgi:hypothetical protein